MKRKYAVFMVLLTVLFNVFIFININKHAIEYSYSDKICMSFIDEPDKKQISEDELLYRINSFADKNKVEIAQYSYLSKNHVDIYTTDVPNYKNSLFLSNLLYKKKVTIHDFSSIRNVGFKGVLYLDTHNKKIALKLADKFQPYFKISCYDSALSSRDSYISYTVQDVLSGNIPVFVSFIAGCFFVLFFSYLEFRREIKVYMLWGYSRTETYSRINRWILLFTVIPIIINYLVVYYAVFHCINSGLLVNYLTSSLLFNVLFLLIVFGISIQLFLFYSSMRNLKSISKITAISYISKFAVALMLFLLVNSTIVKINELDMLRSDLKSWSACQNLYTLNIGYPGEKTDMGAENAQNKKIYKFYKELGKTDNIFVLNTVNYEKATLNKTKSKYNYQTDMKYPGNIYTPYGKTIRADTNYVRKYPIELADNKELLKQIDYNPDVLNVVVPQKYKKKRAIIYSSFKKHFYFMKVSIPNNIYFQSGKGGNKTRIEKNIDDLRVNVIYSKNNQRYFTYDSFSGNSKNFILDPIVEIYTGNIDPSYLSACLGTYFFIRADDAEKMMKNISLLAKKYKIYEPVGFQSVYDKKGEEIQNIEESIHTSYQNAFMFALLLVMLLCMIMISYYIKSYRSITVKILFGYSFFNSFRPLILACCFTNFLALVCSVLLIGKLRTIDITVCVIITMSDIILSKIIGSRLFGTDREKLMIGD